MPIRKVNNIPVRRRQMAIGPDIRPGDPPSAHQVLISMEGHDCITPGFSLLPKAEQERIKARIRFMGIRLRGDLPDQYVPLNKEIMDIP